MKISVTSLLFTALLITAVYFSIDLRYRHYEKKLTDKQADFDSDLFYYNQLNSKEQLLFNAIKSSAESFSDTTDILPCKYSASDCKKVLRTVLFDVPSLFYIDYKNIELYTDNYKSQVFIKYPDSKENLKKKVLELEAVTASALSFTNECTSKYEKETVLHDYLVKNCTYIANSEQHAGEYAHTAYGALVEKTAFCDGYAAAFKILINRTSTECITVEGKADDDLHTWNIIKIDDLYYHTDVTWNDADLEFAPELMFHGYFNLSDEAIKLDHTLSEEYKIPECTDSAHYYLRNGLVADTAEEFCSKVHEQIALSVEKELTYFEIYPDFTLESETIKTTVLEAIEAYNREKGKLVLSPSYRALGAAKSSPALTVQIYYVSDLATNQQTNK